jgi:hypothetical protein
MSNNGETSQTIFTPSAESTHESPDLSCIEHCNQLINEYQFHWSGKVDTILALREVLLESTSVQAGGSLNDALAVYVGILDNFNFSKDRASKQGRDFGAKNKETETQRENRGSDDSQEAEDEGVRSGNESEVELNEQRFSKKSKTIDVSKFPWSGQRSSALASLPQDIWETYQQLDNFALDPKSVVQNILSTPGCPLFPPWEWLNLVRWKYVDLAKVLDSAHTTELDPKQTHVIDDEVELAFRVSKSCGPIKSSADHNTAFTMYIEAISFIFPQRVREFMHYHTYLNRLFIPLASNITPKLSSLTVLSETMAMQRDLHLTDYPEFEQLWTTFLSSFGIGSNSTSSVSSSGGRTNRREGNGGRDDLCYKWNWGTCQKSESECRFAHCCDHRGCRGSHWKTECPKQGGTK